MSGMKKALRKNMMDSSSTTPYCSLQMLWKEKSSTNRVMRAVVKKRPRVYLRPKENSYYPPVRCISTSVKRWRMKEKTNLLKKVMAIMVRRVAARLVMLSWSMWCWSSVICISFKACSTASPLACRITQKMPVMTAMEAMVMVHPRISRSTRRLLPQLMFSQMISLGSGATAISMFTPSTPKYSISLYSSTFSNSSSSSFLISSLFSTMIAFSQVTLSSAINPTCFWYYCYSSSSFSCSFSSISAICLAYSSGLAKNFLFLASRPRFSSRMCWQSSRMLKRTTSFASKCFPWKASARKRLSLRSVWVQWGRLWRMTEQWERRVVRSLQQLRVLLMVSRTQMSPISCTRKEHHRRITSASLTSSSVRTNRISQLVHTPWCPPGRCRCSPSSHSPWLAWQAQQRESAEQLVIWRRRRMMLYLLKMKQRGKPNPRKSSSFVFSHKGIGSLWIMFRQQLQNYCPRSCLPDSPPSFSSDTAIPGLHALPCYSASFQSGSSRSMSYILCLPIIIWMQSGEVWVREGGRVSVGEGEGVGSGVGKGWGASDGGVRARIQTFVPVNRSQPSHQYPILIQSCRQDSRIQTKMPPNTHPMRCQRIPPCSIFTIRHHHCPSFSTITIPYALPGRMRHSQTRSFLLMDGPSQCASCSGAGGDVMTWVGGRLRLDPQYNNGCLEGYIWGGGRQG